MTITLLTGGTGFVGRNIARALRRAGHDVLVFAPQPPVALDDIAFAAGDIRSAADLDRAFAAAPIERVIHAAALTPDAETEAARPQEIVDVNIGGTVALMQAASRAGIARVVGLSSAAVYGYATAGESGALDEDSTVCQPGALYGVTKWAAERTVGRLGSLFGIETATVRLGACFGEEEYPSGARPMLSPQWQAAEAARAGRECVLPRPMRADWIDAVDAADAIVALADAPSLNPVPHNLGGSAVTDLVAWCEALATLRPGFRWRIDPAASTIRYGMERDRAPMDTARLRAAIGFAPLTDRLPERAARYLAWRDGPVGRALCGS